MKKLLLIALLPIALLACNKNDTATGTTKTISSPAALDTLTLTDNGTTYTDTANSASMSCFIERTSTGSLFTLFKNTTSLFPFTIEVSNMPGPMNSVGVYRVAPADSFVTGQYFFEEFNGISGTTYSFDSVMVNITYAGVDTILGNYSLWVRSGTEAKSVSGIIRCYTAQID